MTATLDAPAVDDERLSDTFAALANSTRRAILARLAEGEASVNELAAPFDMSLPAISKHLKVLERAGLVVRSRRAQFRPCTLDAEPLRAVSTWAEQYRPVWEDRFDRMDDYVRRLQLAAPDDAPVDPADPGDPDDPDDRDDRDDRDEPTHERDR